MTRAAKNPADAIEGLSPAQADALPEAAPWKGLPWILFLLALAGVLSAVMFMDVTREIKAVIALCLMFSLMGLGMSVALSMGVSGAIGLFAIMGERPLVATLTQIPLSNAASSTFIVLPLFVFMGLMLWHSGITARLYAASRILFFWLPGGLAATTNIAGAGLGSVSGSTIGITYALGRIAIPEMLRAGYDRRLAVGSVLSAGTIAQLIPPSIMLVIYAGFAEVPVGPQLLAGVMPGLLLTVAYVATVVIVAILRPDWAGANSSASGGTEEPEPTSREKIATIVSAWPVPALIIIILGGMSTGWLTVTEASSVAAVVSALYCLAVQGPKRFSGSLLDSARGTLAACGTVLLLVIGAAILSRLFAVTGAAQWLSLHMQEVAGNTVLFFALLILFYLVLGMFMDPIAMMLLTVPLVMPIVLAAGYSPMWFGVFLVLMAEIGLLTPPVGMLVFIGHRLVQNPEINLGQKISLVDVYSGALLFVPLAVAVVVLLIVFPDIATWLPGQAVR